MPSYQKLPSGNWRARITYYDESGKRKMHSVTAKTKAETVRLASEFIAKDQKSDKKKITLKKAISDYIVISEVLSPTTLQSYNRILEHAFPGIMDRDISTLTDADMQQAINDECRRTSERTGKPISPKTVKNEWGLVAAAIKNATGKTFNIRLPRVARKNEELPDPGIILRAVIGTPVEIPCLLAMCCGLRLSEIRGLTFASIHDGVAFIDKVIVDVDNKPVLKYLAKTDASIRKVSIPDFLNAKIAEKMQKCDLNDYICPMTRNQIYHYFTRIMEKEGLSLSIHDLRHVYASVGLNILAIPQRLMMDAGGWSSPEVISKIYSQSFSDARKQADAKLEAYFTSLL